MKESPESPVWPAGVTVCHQESKSGGDSGELRVYAVAPTRNPGTYVTASGNARRSKL